MRLLDLSRGTSVDFDEILGTQFAAFLPSGDLVFAAGPRTFAIVDASTGERRLIELPDEVAGSIGVIDLIDDRIAVAVVSDDDETETVVLSLAGELQCAGPPNTRFSQLAPGVLWSYPLNARLDLTTCAVSQGSDIPESASVMPITATSDELYATVGILNANGVVDNNTIGQFDLATGLQTATSPRLGRFIADAVVQGDEIWVIADSRLLRLDAETLEVAANVGLAPDVTDCGGVPYFVRQAGDMYLVDDCSPVLYLLDPDTGQTRQGWGFPTDEVSDNEIGAFPSDEGIWMVDVEQTGVPYLFDTGEHRFERLPISDAKAADIYAFDFQVCPGTDD